VKNDGECELQPGEDERIEIHGLSSAVGSDHAPTWARTIALGVNPCETAAFRPLEGNSTGGIHSPRCHAKQSRDRLPAGEEVGKRG
jgi:hypothetical protein